MKSNYFNVTVNHKVTENGEEIIKGHTYRFKKSAVSFPFNSMHKFMECRKSSVILYHYLCETMDKMQTITNNEQLRTGFNLHLKNMGCKKNFAENTVNKGIKELKQVGLLISTPHKGMSHINPRHAYRTGTSIKDRKRLISYFLELLTNPKWDDTNLIESFGKYYEE